jgi:hypothetical protein
VLVPRFVCNRYCVPYALQKKLAHDDGRLWGGVVAKNLANFEIVLKLVELKTHRLGLLREVAMNESHASA